MTSKASQYRVIAENRKARHDYFIQETIEAGIVLNGTEVKSLRAGQGSIQESHAGEMEEEIYLFNAFIPEYLEANRFNHTPRRPRKLLLKRKEINKLLGAIRRKGITLVPLTFHFNDQGRVKVSLGLASGKKQADKRAVDKQRDWERDKARIMRAKG
jgi:SsrA-binding protein